MHARVDLLFGQAHVLRAEGDVGIDGLFKELILRVLHHKAHVEADLAGEFRILPDIASVKEHTAGRRLQKPVHMLHERGFAGAGMADQADKFPAADRQIDVCERGMLERRVRAVDMGKVLYL